MIAETVPDTLSIITFMLVFFMAIKQIADSNKIEAIKRHIDSIGDKVSYIRVVTENIRDEVYKLRKELKDGSNT